MVFFSKFFFRFSKFLMLFSLHITAILFTIRELIEWMSEWMNASSFEDDHHHHDL